MKQQTLPLPNPGDWMTRGAVAEILGCSIRTVERFAIDGTLMAHHPITAEDEKGPLIFWRADVLELEGARKRINRGKSLVKA